MVGVGEDGLQRVDILAEGMSPLWSAPLLGIVDGLAEAGVDNAVVEVADMLARRDQLVHARQLLVT